MIKKIIITLLLLISAVGVSGHKYIYKYFLTSEDADDTYTESISSLVYEPTGNAEIDSGKIGAILYASEYNGTDEYIVLNNNQPFFSTENINLTPYEYYSELDNLGRCGPATAFIDSSLMPTEERGYIGNVRPSGFQTVKYPDVIEDLYLFNRGHLIAFCLCGENDNPNNLITMTRQCNLAMTDFEYPVNQYLHKNPNNHVLYRVTPVFSNQDLVAEGVIMEGYSVEDKGQSVCFCVFIYNAQKDIIIDYTNGDSRVVSE